MDDIDILIVGGGFTGCALACALADGHRRIHVMEARATPSTRFAGELLHPTGVADLERLGLLQPLLAAGGVKVRGFSVSPGFGRRETLLPYPGGHGLGIEHHLMVACLQREAERRPGVSFERGVRVDDLLREEGAVVGVATPDGDRLASLVLCADGRHSRLRPGEVEAKLLSFTAALKVKDAPLPHPDHGHIFLGGWGPILAYPIARDEARLCFDLPAGVKRDEVAQRLETHLLPPALRRAVEEALVTRPLELVANHHMSVRDTVAAGLALVGDSGGCAHPLTAAGMTICLHDVRLIAETIADGGSLADYAAARRGFVRSRHWLTRSLYHVFRAPDPASRRLREGVFRYWEDDRARAASTALLTGADPSLRGFFRELARVALSAVRA
jgi:2-polyprenyl-6-methoxyphenol hydroxylase-like FAD-dependent oxidoreductase